MATEEKQGTLYLLAGPSGSGKSTLSEAATESIPGLQLFGKGSTRTPRPGDRDVHWDPSLRDLSNNRSQAVYLGADNSRYGTPVERIGAVLDGGYDAVMVCVDHGVTEYLRSRFPGRVMVVFVHRDLTAEMEKTMNARGGSTRLGQRISMYAQLAGGSYRPDRIVLNTGTIAEAVEQLRLVMTSAKPLRPSESVSIKGVLHIVVAPTGTLKDAIEVGAQSLPDWGEAFIKKDKIAVKLLPANYTPPPYMLEYVFFGQLYRVPLTSVITRLRERHVAFITVSDLPTARRLKAVVEKKGFSAELHYLHQTDEEIQKSVLGFPEAEWGARRAHATNLTKQYREELVLEAHPILAVNGERDVVAWVQKCINERPRGGWCQRIKSWWER